MLGKTYDAEVCSMARALEVVGERWSLLIVRDALFAGSTRFGDFQRTLGVATNVLTTRLAKASDIRYSLRYLAVHQECTGELRSGCKAAVDIMIDASFTIANAMGQPKRPDKRDQNQLNLEWTCGDPTQKAAANAQPTGSCRWMFISGM